jgi:hypothetical protein
MEDLKILYKQFYKENNFNISPTVWDCETNYIKQSFDMNFRGENAYVWQCQLGDDENIYIEYYKKIKQIDKENLLSRTKEDGSYGCICFEVDNIKISRDLLDSILEIYYLKSVFPNLEKMNLLEIGAGYGRLCKRYLDCFPESTYCITDAIAESTYLSKIYLGKDHADKVINLFDIENVLKDLKIDIAINIHSFPECNIHDIEWWVKLLHDNNVKYIFYIPNNPNSNPVYMPTNNGYSILDIYNKYGYILKDYKNFFNELDIKYSYICPFFILENKSVVSKNP